MASDNTPDRTQDLTAPEPIEMATLNHDQAQAHAYSPLPSTSNLTNSVSTSWHPKISPYRLANILIPMSVGTSKAVVSQRSNSTAPVTLELVSGVVVFLVLFHAGYYESNEQLPRLLAWAFQPDCMELLWRLLDFLSIPRPKYRSDEHIESETVSIVTSYRLLVSATIISFGLTKASLTYAGFSIVSTWMEWLLGAVITSILYIVGLYENSSADIWPTFFRVGRDRNYVLRYTGKKVSYSLLMGLGVLFTLSALSTILVSKISTYIIQDSPTGKDLIYPRDEDIGHQEPLRKPSSVYQHSLDFLPIVPQLIIGITLLFLGSLWGLSDIPRSELAVPVLRLVWGFVRAEFHAIGHFLNIVACAICLAVSFVLPLALMDDRNSYGREPSDIFIDLIMWSGFIGLWAFIIRFMWWSMKEFSKDIAHRMRRMLFRRLAALNYAFWELSDAFRTSPV